MKVATQMKRTTISLPDDVDRAILMLKRTSKYERSSYAEIVRDVLSKALTNEGLLEKQ